MTFSLISLSIKSNAAECRVFYFYLNVVMVSVVMVSVVAPKEQCKRLVYNAHNRLATQFN